MQIGDWARVKNKKVSFHKISETDIVKFAQKFDNYYICLNGVGNDLVWVEKSLPNLEDLLEVEDIFYLELTTKLGDKKEDIVIIKDKHYLDYWQRVIKYGDECVSNYRIIKIIPHENLQWQEVSL